MQASIRGYPCAPHATRRAGRDHDAGDAPDTPVEIFKLHSTLHLKLLDEVAVPVQSGFKGGQRTRPAAPVLSFFSAWYA